MTIEKIIPRVEDQIFGSKPFLFALTNFGNVETLDGGTTIEQPLMYAELRNQGSYSGADTFLTEEDEGHTRAVFEWKQYYAMLVLKNIDLAKNSGPSAVLRIVDQELRRAELSISEELDRIFLSDGTGNGGKDFTGIKKIVSDTIPYGGIDPTVGGNEWWQSKVTTSLATWRTSRLIAICIWTRLKVMILSLTSSRPRTFMRRLMSSLRIVSGSRTRRWPTRGSLPSATMVCRSLSIGTSMRGRFMVLT